MMFDYTFTVAALIEELNKLRDQLAAAKADRDRLVSALRGLLDQQNGPPLVRDTAEWHAAMHKALRCFEAVQAAAENEAP